MLVFNFLQQELCQVPIFENCLHLTTNVLCFQEKSSTSNLKIEALVFTRLVMVSHSPSVFHPFIQVQEKSCLVPHVLLIRLFVTGFLFQVQTA